MGNGAYIYVPGRNYDITIDRIIKAEKNLLEEEKKHTDVNNSRHHSRMIPSFMEADMIAGITSLNKSMEKYHSFVPPEDNDGKESPLKKKKKHRKKKATLTSPDSNKKKKKSNLSTKAVKKINATITPGTWKEELKEEVPDPKVAEKLRKEGLKQWERIFGLNKRIELTSSSSSDDEQVVEEKKNEELLNVDNNHSNKEVMTTPPANPREGAILIDNNNSSGGYVRYFDDESASFYFYHPKTGKSTWVRPIGWKTPARGSIAPLPTVPNDETTNWTELARKSPIKRRKGVWSEHLDEESGCYWYHNSSTGQSTWEKPDDDGENDNNKKGEEGGSAWEEYEWVPPQYNAQQDVAVGHEAVGHEAVGHEAAGTLDQHYYVQSDGKVIENSHIHHSLEEVLEKEENDQNQQENNENDKNDASTNWYELTKKSPVKRRRGDWNEHYDEESGEFWYYNWKTEEHTWKQPENWDDRFNYVEENTNWTDVRATTSPVKKVQNGNWTEHYDEESGAYWYYNWKTEEHTWEQPKEWASSSGELSLAKNHDVVAEYQQQQQEPTSTSSYTTPRDQPTKSPLHRQYQQQQEEEHVEHQQEEEYAEDVEDIEENVEEVVNEKAVEEETVNRVEQTPEVEQYWNELKATSPIKRKHGQWSEHLDEETGAYWYHNNVTNESSWNQPYEWDDLVEKDEKLKAEEAQEAEVITGRRQEEAQMYNLKHHTNTHEEWEKLKLTTPVKRKRAIYSEHYDEESGAYWYYNTETGKCTWEVPEDWDRYKDQEEFVLQQEQQTNVEIEPPLAVENTVEHSLNQQEEIIAFELNAKDKTDGWEIGGVNRRQMEDDEDGQWGQLPSKHNTNWEQVAIDSPLRRVVGDWEEHYDPASECYWYYNTATGEHTWEQPSHWGKTNATTEKAVTNLEWNVTDDTTNKKKEHNFENGPLSPVGWPKEEGDNKTTDWNAVGMVSPAQSTSGEWHKLLDPVTGCPWWYNTKTKEKTWHEPENWSKLVAESVKKSLKKKKRMKEAAAAAASGDNNTNWNELMQLSPSARRTYNGWEEHVDPDSGHYWYYHTIEHTSTWEKPKE